MPYMALLGDTRYATTVELRQRSLWRYKMEPFSTLLAVCERNHRWIPLTKASDAELWSFLWYALKQMVEQTIETQVIRDTIASIMPSLWCSNVTICELLNLLLKAYKTEHRNLYWVQDLSIHLSISLRQRYHAIE